MFKFFGNLNSRKDNTYVTNNLRVVCPCCMGSHFDSCKVVQLEIIKYQSVCTTTPSC